MLEKLAPIALFAFRRPTHLRNALDALRRNRESVKSELIIFCDGCRNERDSVGVSEVRSLAKSAIGFEQVTVIERDGNWGLAKSITSGVTEILRQHDCVIVVEDDLVVSEHFLRYMNDALELYASDHRVVSIHGYCYPVDTPLPDTFFLKGADCWGWATWNRGWNVFNEDGATLLRELYDRDLIGGFDFGGNYDFTQMLRDQIAGRNDSWAIRWYASAFLADKLTLYPGQSLVQNTGIDGSGTHCGSTSAFESARKSRPIKVGGVRVEDSEVARLAFSEYFHRLRTQVPEQRDSWILRLLKRLVRI